MMLTEAFLLAALLTLAATASHSDVPPAPPSAVIEIEGDLRITDDQRWENVHYRIHGNLILEAGGTLTLDHATVELMNTYARQFNFLWRGGALISRHSTLGGTTRDGAIYHSNLELQQGEWTCTDTTIRYSYGIALGGGDHVGKLRATRLIAGPSSDAVIMSGRGDVVIEDSSFSIALTAPASGGSAVFDLPVNTPINQVYDSSNIPGVQYRLQLINTTVPVWFLFAQVSMDGPPSEFVLRRCPRLIPSVMGHNLQGELQLPSGAPVPAGSSFTTANLTWRVTDEPAHIICWGVYLTGDQNDVTVPGPTVLAEIMLWGGKLAVSGREAADDIRVAATTIEVGNMDIWVTGDEGQPAAGPRAELLLRNLRLGRRLGEGGIPGQITAWPGGRVTVENAACADLVLITRGDGEIALSGIKRDGEIKTIQQGGPIRFLDDGE